MIHIRSSYFSTFFFVATFTNAGKAFFFPLSLSHGTQTHIRTAAYLTLCGLFPGTEHEKKSASFDSQYLSCGGRSAKGLIQKADMKGLLPFFYLPPEPHSLKKRSK